jgi:hypothetical protein
MVAWVRRPEDMDFTLVFRLRFGCDGRHIPELLTYSTAFEMVGTSGAKARTSVKSFNAVLKRLLCPKY